MNIPSTTCWETQLRISYLQVGDHDKAGHQGRQIGDALELLGALLHIAPVLLHKASPQLPGIVQRSLLKVLCSPPPLLFPATCMLCRLLHPD